MIPNKIRMISKQNLNNNRKDPRFLKTFFSRLATRLLIKLLLQY